MVGYVPNETAASISRLIANGDVADCLSVWQKPEKREKVYLRALQLGSGCEVAYDALGRLAEDTSLEPR